VQPRRQSREVLFSAATGTGSPPPAPSGAAPLAWATPPRVVSRSASASDVAQGSPCIDPCSGASLCLPVLAPPAATPDAPAALLAAHPCPGSAPGPSLLFDAAAAAAASPPPPWRRSAVSLDGDLLRPEALPKPPTIMAVDDNPINLLVIARMLESGGMRVIKCSSGAEALRRLTTADVAALPDLLLLDVMMPGVSGLQLCRCAAAARRAAPPVATAPCARCFQANALVSPCITRLR
jgi:Response regulator receiver domain